MKAPLEPSPYVSTIEKKTLEEIAAKYGLEQQAFANFINDVRQQARTRRRRLSDSQIAARVTGLKDVKK